MQKKRNFDVKKIERTCSLCGRVFYAKKNTASFCSDSCKQIAYEIRQNNKQGIHGDLNKDLKIKPGTITSKGSRESEHYFSGNFEELKNILTDKFISEKQLNEEMKFLKLLQPICETRDWFGSSCQIFTNTHLLEVMKINFRMYKVYAYRWESPDENPLPFKS